MAHLLFAILAALGGCRAPTLTFSGLPAQGIVPLSDADPDPMAFVGALTAGPATIALADGTRVAGLGYDGQVPGPLIRVPLGARVTIDVDNALPDGAHTAVHWHGIEGSNAADGTPVTQLPIAPGAPYTYAFTATRPGLYWYHPHLDGSQTVFSGMYGPLVVDDPDEPALVAAGVVPANELLLVFSDLSQYDGQVLRVPSEGEAVMNGTEGDEMLVNGWQTPTYRVPARAPTRLRVVNTSIARYWRLSVPGHLLYRIGGQGGLLDAVRIEGGAVPATVTSLADGAFVGDTEVALGYDRGEILLAPAERVDLVLQPIGEPGETLDLVWKDYARGRHQMWVEDGEVLMGEADDDGLRPSVVVAHFALEDDPNGVPWALDEGDPVLGAVGRAVGAVPDPVDPGQALDWTGDRAMVLAEDMSHTVDGAGNWQMTSTFYLDGASWHGEHDGGPDQPLAPTAVHATLGDVITWEVRNETEMDHPIHLHGFSYAPLGYFRDNPVAGTRTTWGGGYDTYEDTTSVPGGASLLLVMPLTDPVGDGSAAGRWMRHCHLLQHGENGMMSELVVDP